MDADDVRGDELMHARLHAAGERWRGAKSTGPDAPPVDVAEVIAPRTGNAPRRQRWALIASAAVVVGALVAGGAWFATRSDNSGSPIAAGASNSSGPVSGVGPPRPYGELVGIDWKIFSVTSDAHGSSDSLDTSGSSADFQIAADGTVGGSDGCNGGSGHAVISNDTIQFGPIARTLVGCLGPNVSKISSTIDAVIAGTVAWHLSASNGAEFLSLTKAGVGELIFIAQPPVGHVQVVKLTGRWQLSSYSQTSANSGTGSAAAGGYDTYVTFTPGHFATEERCYDTAGEVVVDGTTATFSGTHDTMALPCPATQDMQAEQTRTALVDATLNGATKVSGAGSGAFSISKGGVELTFTRVALPR
jgi:heat shock protein HslJ